MLTLIRNGFVYAHGKIGIADLLFCAGRIVRLDERIEVPSWCEVVDATDRIISPGFIDIHVHVTGGGGEDGPATRTPEIRLSEITTSGVTTVVGLLGTDDVTRHPESLLAKVLSLQKEGVSAYMLTGSYQFPPVTITGSVRRDIALIPPVIGAGEIALSDHRSSEPGFEEFIRLVAEARVGGLLGGKCGIVQVHMGSGRRGMEYLLRMADETDIPISQVLPTHVTRSQQLLDEAVIFAKRGGNIDITASGTRTSTGIGSAVAIRQFRSADVPMDRITVSSDSNGSIPRFDQEGSFIGMAVAEIGELLNEFRTLVVEEGFTVPEILRLFTMNPASRTGLQNTKGSIDVGKDADLVIFNPDWSVDRVYALGKLMVSDGQPVVKGTFE